MRILTGALIAIIGLAACGPVPSPAQNEAQAASDLIQRDAEYAANLEAASIKVAAEKADRAARATCLADHKADPSTLSQALALSDDWGRYRTAMLKTTAQLVCDDRCGVLEIEDQGGWMASPNRGAGYYFMYCGGQDHVRYRLYMNVSTGEISR